MKSAKIFLAGMYLHLLLSIVVPGTILKSGASTGWANNLIWLLIFYLLMIGVVLLIGWISVGMAVVAYRKSEAEKLRKSWKLLKYASMPFYVLNFVYSFCVWFLLVGASRGILIILVPIPILITCTMVFQSGCFGWCYIRYCNKQFQGKGNISSIHYCLQVIPVLDIMSTFIVDKKYREKSDMLF